MGSFEELEFSLQEKNLLGSEFSLLALFINVGYYSIAPSYYYSCCTIPFLLALILFIPGLLNLIENHMKLMEINPTLL